MPPYNPLNRPFPFFWITQTQPWSIHSWNIKPFDEANQARFYHGKKIRTGIACKKIPCYVSESACKWLFVKQAEKFRSYVKHFWILADVRKCRILIGYANRFFELSNHISRLTQWNKVSASFFFLLLRLLMKKI